MGIQTEYNPDLALRNFEECQKPPVRNWWHDFVCPLFGGFWHSEFHEQWFLSTTNST